MEKKDNHFCGIKTTTLPPSSSEQRRYWFAILEDLNSTSFLLVCLSLPATHIILARKFRPPQHLLNFTHLCKLAFLSPHVARSSSSSSSSATSTSLRALDCCGSINEPLLADRLLLLFCWPSYSRYWEWGRSRRKKLRKCCSSFVGKFALIIIICPVDFSQTPPQPTSYPIILFA